MKKWESVVVGGLGGVGGGLCPPTDTDRHRPTPSR
jgi:hypothetical protein